MERVPPELPRMSFDELLESARTGSREALGRLLEMCRVSLQEAGTPHVDARLKAKDAPSDLLQDTFLEAVRDFPQFRGKSREDLLAWIFRILQNNRRNVERNYTRTKRQVAAELRLDDPHAVGDLKQRLLARTRSPSSEIAHREETSSLQHAVDDMPEYQRTIIHMRSLEHRSFEDIAAHLHSSPEAVRQIWHRAIRQLAWALKLRRH
jgi:RNA polymerase sigma-70 factor (ECF subfamily)